MSHQPEPHALRRLSSGVVGLDEILHGGLIAGQSHLVHGGPGSGKTTLCLHFLAQGLKEGERALCVTFSESEQQLRRNGSAMGLRLDDVRFMDLSPTSTQLSQVQTYDVYSPTEVELESLTKRVLEQVRVFKPHRIMVDALTQLKYLTTDVTQFHRQAHGFLRFLAELGTTVVVTSEPGRENNDEDLQFLTDTIVHLSQAGAQRWLKVTKQRGSNFRAGNHSMRLSSEGITVHPRLPVPDPVVTEPDGNDVIASGIEQFDALLHGGLERGTLTIISGPTGVGKSTVGMHFMARAAERGDGAVVYTFDERVSTLLRRCDGTGIPARAMVARGALTLRQLYGAELNPLEFKHAVRQDLEQTKARIVMVDSTRVFSALGEEGLQDLSTLCKFLIASGLTVLVVSALDGIAQEMRAGDAALYHLADNVIFMRYLERHMEGRVEIRKAVGVLKKRLGDFEKTLRELEVTPQGIRVGAPMPRLDGILSGIPKWLELGP